MKLLVEVDGKRCSLDLRVNGAHSNYTLEGAEEASGSASIAAITPGLYSVLLGERSFTVSVARTGENLEVWVAGRRYSMAVSDSRDRSVAAPANAAGPLEVRSQMPGKVVKLLVEVNAQVDAGQGLLVVEAMKMQNEIMSPKDGCVLKICVAEGATVANGEVLIVVG
jgi:biotin carboxyl carrier protein